MDKISISNRRSAFGGIVCTVKEYKQLLCPKQSPVYNFKKYNLSIFVSHWLLPVLVKWPRIFGYDWLIVNNFIIYFQFTWQAFSSPPHSSPLPKPLHTSQDFQSLSYTWEENHIRITGHWTFCHQRDVVVYTSDVTYKLQTWYIYTQSVSLLLLG